MLSLADIKRDYLHIKNPKPITFEELKAEFEILHKKGFIFRGQNDSRLPLTPYAFRENVLEELYPVPALDYHKWLESDHYKEIVLLYGHNDANNQWEVERISKLAIYFLQYNYALAEYIATCPEKFDLQTQERFEKRGVKYWTEEDTFLRIFSETICQAETIIQRDNKTIKQGEINEEYTGFEQSLPQHYGTPTTSFDWTYNPYIACFFALRKATDCISVFAYQELRNSDKNPFELRYGHQDINNRRIERQEGLFIHFRRACRYYFYKGKWPSMNDYIFFHKGNFEIIKFDIPIFYKPKLAEILEEKKIDYAFLFPDQ